MVKVKKGIARGVVTRRDEVRPEESSQSTTKIRRASVLNDVAMRIDAGQTREEILQALRSETRRLFHYDISFLSVLNRTGSHYAVSTLSPVTDAADFNHKHFSINEGMPGWAMQNGASIVENITSSPAFSENLEGMLVELGIKSMLVVPLRSGSETIGALTFGSTQVDSYREDDLSVAQLLGSFVAIGIKNMENLDKTRRHISQIELINGVSGQLTAMLNLDELLRVAATSIQKTFNYFDVTVFLLSEDRSDLILEAHSGNFIDFLPHGYRQSVSTGLVGWVAQNGEKVLCNDVSRDPRYLVYEYHNTRSELAIPIKVDQQVVGVLNVEDTKLHAFDETDAMVLETLSDQLGTAIKNAKLYEEVHQANMKLTELDTMKSEFLGIVSHDFRSPLSSIILAGKALLKHEAAQEHKRVKEYLQIIVDQANRLNQLAEDTLSITKMESGQLSYLFKIVNVYRLIQDAISMVRFTSRHTVSFDVDQEVTFIKGDQTKLRQVLQNVISNAVKYSPRGGKVSVLAREESPDQIIISVSDEGIGIPADKIEKLFKKFSRVDTGEASQIKGAGLGLWICREIVEAHGGKIWIESEMGSGTTVKFTLNKAQ